MQVSAPQDGALAPADKLAPAAHSTSFQTLLIRAASRWAGALVPQPPPLLLIRDAQHDLWWQPAIDACRPGDVPILHWWGTRLSLELVVDAPPMRRSPAEATAAAGQRSFLVVQPADRSGLPGWVKPAFAM